MYGLRLAKPADEFRSPADEKHRHPIDMHNLTASLTYALAFHVIFVSRLRSKHATGNMRARGAQPLLHSDILTRRRLQSQAFLHDCDSKWEHQVSTVWSSETYLPYLLSRFYLPAIFLFEDPERFGTDCNAE